MPTISVHVTTPPPLSPTCTCHMVRKWHLHRACVSTKDSAPPADPWAVIVSAISAVHLRLRQLHPPACWGVVVRSQRLVWYILCLFPLPYFTHSCGLEVAICLKCLTQGLSMLSSLISNAQWENKHHVTLEVSTPDQYSESASNSRTDHGLAGGSLYSGAHRYRRRMTPIHPLTHHIYPIYTRSPNIYTPIPDPQTYIPHTYPISKS